MAIETGLLIGGILTVMLYTRVLYKDTILYDIAEHLLLGSATAYIFVTGIKSIMSNAITPIQNEGRYILIIPIILGLSLYTQLSEKTRYMSRIPLSIIVGVGLGLTIRRVLLANLVRYTQTAFRPFMGVDGFTAINNVIITLAMITSISYFLMSRDQTGTYGQVTRIGRIFLMVTFGAYFGGQIMGRLTLLAGRIEYLLKAFGIISF